MKSKFSQVVNVKKQALDRAEAKVAQARLNVANYEAKLNQARANLDSFALPKQGNISELNQNLELLKIMRSEVLSLNERLEIAKKELLHFTHQYKNANLDYEKMKFLKDEEIKQKLKEIKRKEELLLDEFATIKFAQNMRNL
ncbi:flagellar export protein FliJ [Campylobacter gastrosuis]|uniref:Flagellar FliJ protein n=1 Tax=Campylobacter gastrosuis TaxID=2974576 RepID=A0ABT7HPH9_9BACT|nr:flagellar export protein FliJ [Campylobacter gastrosuis]MDL0088830.1 flagellar export protein FliJ [Campylobacter gastrosuis]